ncbi:MAG: cyclic nucleotide-binding domain-containing protein [Deltaproteobacteria bacterium]|nr:cyclic nucleotide-binding domain-containing protein [Deltaproteobacteria bacterium]
MDGAQDNGSPASKNSIFDYLPDEKMAEIAKLVETRIVPAGAIIFREGEPGDSFFIIRYGRVRAFRTDEEGIETDLGELGPGDSFGELALLTGNPRSASAEAIEKTCLGVLPKRQFDQILQDYPLVALSFVNQISKLLFQDWSKLEQEVQRRYRPPRLSWFDFFIIFGLMFLCGLFYNEANPNGIDFVPRFLAEEPISSMSPSLALKSRNETGALFVDARPADFYGQKHIEGAVNIPLELFDIMYMMELHEMDKSRNIIVYGRTISSLYDERVARRLMLRGHRDVFILAGGVSAWQKKGYPVEP